MNETTKTKIAETRTKLITELQAELAQLQIDLLLEELAKSQEKPDEADIKPYIRTCSVIGKAAVAMPTSDGQRVFSIIPPKPKKLKTPKKTLLSKASAQGASLKAINPDFMTTKPEDMINSMQLCKVLDISYTWLRVLIKKGTVPKPTHNKRYWAEADLPKIKEAVEKARSRPRRFRKKPLASQAFNDHSELLMDIEMVDEVETTQAKDGVLGRWAKKLRLGLD